MKNTLTRSTGDRKLSFVIAFLAALLFACLPARATLVGFWRFDEGGGMTTADWSGNGNTGTLVNGPTWVPGFTNALSFDGVDDYVDMGSPASGLFDIGPTQSFSYGAWIKPTLADSTRRRIISKRNGTAAGTVGYDFSIGSSGLEAEVSDGISEIFTTSVPVRLNEWYFAMAVVDRSANLLRLYVNGVESANVDISTLGSLVNATSLNIGRPPGSSSYSYQGIIDEVRLYNQALTDAEIMALAVSYETVPLKFLTEPVSQTVQENLPVTFTASVSGSPPYFYQWRSNSVAIEGATDSSYTIPLVAMSMSMSAYSVIASNLAQSITSSNAILTVSSDLTKPVFLSVGSADGNLIGLCFNEGLDSATANDPNNYTVNSGAVTVTSATLRTDGQTIALTVSPAVAGTFSVLAKNVNDLAGNGMINTTLSGTVFGFTVQDVGYIGPFYSGSTFNCTNAPSFELTAGGAGFPYGNAMQDQGHLAVKSTGGNFDVQTRVRSLTDGGGSANAGLMVRNSFTPGSAMFYVMVSKNGQVSAIWRQAEDLEAETRASAPLATPNAWVRLRRVGQQFTAYYSADGTAWTQLAAVTTEFLNDPAQLGLAGSAQNDFVLPLLAKLESYGNVTFTGVTLDITQDPTNLTVNANQVANFYVVASASGPASETLAYEWQRGNGSGGFTNIPGAQSATLSFTATAADHLAQFRVKVYYADQVRTSTAGTLTVSGDITPPTLSVARAMGDPARVRLVFSEALDPTSSQDTASYHMTNTAGTSFTFQEAYLDATTFGASRRVRLTVSPDMTVGSTNVLWMSGVEDTAGNPVPANTLASFKYDPDALIGYWPMMEGSGTTTADLSDYGPNNGTLYGAVWVAGWAGFGLSFNRSLDNYVELPRPADGLYDFDNVQDFSCAVWAYPQASSSGMRLISNRQGPDVEPGWEIGSHNGGLFITVADGINPRATSVASPLAQANNAWNHVVLVVDRTNSVALLYRNGVLGRTLDITGLGPFNSTKPVTFGRLPGDATRDLTGVLDHVCLYSRALTETEIAAMAVMPIPVSAVVASGQITLTWAGPGVLEWATNVLGPWTAVTPTPAASPYSTALVAGQDRFFRVRLEP